MPKRISGAAGEIKALNDGRSDGDVGQLADSFDVAGGNGSAATPLMKRGVGRADDHVRADAVGADLVVVDLAEEDGGNGDDHHHFNGDGSGRDDGAHGAVNQVGQDQLVHKWTESVQNLL
jgi:hypothetical protein